MVFKLTAHGGARTGAGRKQLTWAQLLAERRFDWRNARHRQLLEAVDLPADAPEELHELQRRYRNPWGARAWFAQEFARKVAGLPCAFE